MNRKAVLTILLALMVVSGGGIGYYYWYQGAHFVKTEDARIQGDQYRIMPQIAGEITRIAVEEGEVVQKNQEIAQQDTSNMDASMIDKTVLRAPIAGTVTKIFNKEHEMGSPSQPVALIVDTHALYVSANIEETEITRVKAGQPVEVTVDTLGGKKLTGKVRKVGMASNSTFSLVPAVNTSGNFNKVTQRIPIEIAIEQPSDVQLIPGTNVEIKIRVS